MVDVRRRAFGGVVAAGVVLGLLAFAADFVDGAAGQVMVALTSSGFAWGLAAFIAGRADGRRSGREPSVPASPEVRPGLVVPLSPEARPGPAVPAPAEVGRGRAVPSSSMLRAGAAVARATGLLVSATLVYYLLVLVGTRRWLAGGVVADGLRDVAFATALWVAGSLVAGTVLGLLGHVVREAPAPRGAAALGAACGLLAGDGWQDLIEAPPSLLLALGDPFVNGFVAAELVQAVLPVVVLVWLATVHGLWRSWMRLAVACVGAAVTSALVWDVLDRF
ncbi:hypothetical protein [Actinoplanes sp. URMC 104]|uniref:hypothetical protein n=1 Tax=Actinoplanes sp. URMC 104 TaxID=3423409 RepID=UPI003F1C1CE2